MTGVVASVWPPSSLGPFLAATLLLSAAGAWSGWGILRLAGGALPGSCRWFLAAPTGLCVTATFWALAVCLGASPSNAKLWGVPLALGLAGWRWPREKREGRADTSRIVRDGLPAALTWTAAFLFMAYLLGGNLVYPAWDSQSTGYFAWLMEREGRYPVVHPFPGSPARLYIDYPPAFDLMPVLLHRLLPWPLETLQLGAAVAVSTLFAVAVGGVVHLVTASPWWGMIGGIGALARAFLWQTTGGNSTENLAMLAMATALGWIGAGLPGLDRRAAVLAGLCASAALLSNGKVFQLYAVSLGSAATAALLWRLRRPTDWRRLVAWLALAFLGCALPAWPWARLAFQHVRVMSDGEVYFHAVLNLWRSVARWNETSLVWLALAGAVVAMVRGPLLGRLLAWHGLCCLAVTGYWKGLQWWSPSWFQIRTIPFNGWLDTDTQFATRFPYPYPNEVGFIGYTIALPVLAALAVWWVQQTAARGARLAGPLPGRFAWGLAGVAGGVALAMGPTTTKTAEALGSQLLTPADYRILKWMERHTDPSRTFLLNPWHGSPSAEGNWAAQVSNRPTVFFRSDAFMCTWLDSPPDTELLKPAYLEPGTPSARARLRRAGVTHVFIPTSLSADLLPKYRAARGYRIAAQEDGPGGRVAAIAEVFR